jgi:fatty-acyl-CoA synthase
MDSYARGPAFALTTQTAPQAFSDTAQKFAELEALVVPHQKIRLSWSQLADEVEKTARGLTGLGLAPGDRVGVWATNCAEWIYLQLGCARAGLVLVNVNPAYRALELAYVLKRSGIKALFLRCEDARSKYRDILEQAIHGEILALEHVVYLGEESWDRMIANGVDIPTLDASCHDAVNIQYTSGTTGSPKGVLLTHHNLVNNGRIIAHGLRYTENDRLCSPVPMYHCFGCVIGTMAVLASGATLILPAPSFDPLATMQAIHDERATSIYGVPTMFIAQLTHPEFSRFDFTSLRTGVMAGAPCPIEVMNKIVNDMHCSQMTIMYGQTECSPIITMARVDDSVERRVSTVGCTCPETEIKIISETGAIVAIGQQGELCTRGYANMKGYDQDADATARAIDSDGWLHTGDLATMRPDGYFRITGRLKDMIIRGGENIYPREVEEFLYTHPKIADVQVVGLPDERLGETVAAWIKLKAGETAVDDEIREFCKGKIAHFKIPQTIRFVDSFPMTVTGKIQKYVIRQTEIRERHLEKAANIETA